MIPNRFVRWSGVVATVSLAATAVAEPLNTGLVPSKAAWLMHADMDAARDSTVFKRMEARVFEKFPHAEQMMAMGAGMIGMDIRKDLHDVTVYGLDTDKQNAVMIVHAKADRKKLEAMVAKAPGHKTMEYRDYTLHAWTHKGWHQSEGKPVVGAFHDDTTMVFARTKEQVEMALDVVDGQRPSVGDEGPLSGRVRPGSILVARAREVNPETKCPVLREGKGFRVAMGEYEGKSFYRAILEMKSAEAAEQATTVTEGLVALGSLRFGGEADVMNLIKGVATVTRGNECMITWDASADEVWTVMERVAERMEAKMAERKAQWSRMKKNDGDRSPKKRSGKASPESDKPFRDDEF